MLMKSQTLSTPTLEQLRQGPGRLGVIAGNGRFPLLVLEKARQLELPVQVAAIQEEASPEIESFRSQQIEVEWLGVGQLGKLLRIFRRAGVHFALMAGQVEHVKIFAPGTPLLSALLKAKPDWRILRLLHSLPRKDTESLIGGIIDILAGEGVEFLSSAFLLQDSLAEAGQLSRRAPNLEEAKDIAYGRPLARRLAELELGQSIVVKQQAVIAIEAMEGTDATIERAAGLVPGATLTLIKAARPRQDMRFDIPVLGLETLETCHRCNVTALALDPGKTLLLDKQKFLRRADELGLTIMAE